MEKQNLRLLTASVLGIDSVNGQRTAMLIPEGATVELAPGSPAEAGMVNVLWEGRLVAVFSEDLFERGKAVKSGSA